MASITICGDAVVIKSAETLDNLKLLQKYKPEALCLMDEDGNAVFKVGVASREAGGQLNNFGASFASVTRDADGLATITMISSGSQSGAELVSDVSDKFGPAIIKLSRVEEQFASAIEQIAKDKAEVLEHITLA